MLEYLSSNLWLVWTLACVFALILEVTSGTFYLMCFALGAACSIIASLLFTPLWIQVLVFAIGSALCVFGVRPFAMKYLNPRRTRTNSEELIGEIVKVTDRIDNRAAEGKALAKGMEWTARAISDDMLIEKDSLVKVVRIEGVKLIVEPVPDEQS